MLEVKYFFKNISPTENLVNINMVGEATKQRSHQQQDSRYDNDNRNDFPQCWDDVDFIVCPVEKRAENDNQCYLNNVDVHNFSYSPSVSAVSINGCGSSLVLS